MQSTTSAATSSPLSHYWISAATDISFYFNYSVPAEGHHLFPLFWVDTLGRVDLFPTEKSIHGRVKGKLKFTPKVKLTISLKHKFVSHRFDKRAYMGFQGIHGSYRRG